VDVLFLFPLKKKYQKENSWLPDFLLKSVLRLVLCYPKIKSHMRKVICGSSEQEEFAIARLNKKGAD
jgi:hypothetical protein